MSLHPFMELLGFEQPADFDAVERRFLDVVRERLQKPIVTYDEQHAASEEAWLRDIYHRYFAFALEWVLEESSKHKGHPTPEAQKLRKAGRELLNAMHTGMIDYACCDLRLSHSTARIREQVRSEEARLGGPREAMKWSPDAAAMLPKLMSQKKQMLDIAQRWQQALPLLEVLDRELQTLRQSLEKAAGAERAEALMRSYSAALRIRDFDRARQAHADIVEAGKKTGQAEVFQKSGDNIIALCEERQDLFVSEDKRLYLKPGEIEQARAALMKDINRVKGAMAKYYRSYMQNKIDVMTSHRDKLQLIGLIEGQVILYRRLLAGFARPLNDMKDVRGYESEVLEKIKYLIHYKYAELPVIRARADDTVNEFLLGSKEFREIEDFDTGLPQDQEQQPRSQAAGA